MEPSEFESTFGDILFAALEAARGPPPTKSVSFNIPMENYLQDDSNVITMNSLNTTIVNAKEDYKLGEAGFDEYDIFSPPSFEEEICFDNTVSPIADNCNDACDIFSSPTDSIPFKIPMGIAARVRDDRYVGDGLVHPSAHLLKLTELCELFKVAGLSQEEIMKKLFPLSLKDNAKEIGRASCRERV